jgi:chromosome partitioning protein
MGKGGKNLMLQRIVAIINQKGGVGKTTTSINLASSIAMLGRKVLLVDLDPQAHSTIVLGGVPDSFPTTIQDVLVNKKEIACAITKTCIENLDLAPSNIHLDRAEQLLIPEMFRETKLSKALSGLDYEFILIDCRPTLGILSVNALCAAGIVLIPCETARFSLEGFADLLNTIKALKIGKDQCEQLLLRILLCKFDPRKAISNEWVLKQLDPHKALLFNTRIRQCEALNQAHMAKESIFSFKPNSNGAEDYMKLGKEFLESCFQSEKN